MQYSQGVAWEENKNLFQPVLQYKVISQRRVMITVNSTRSVMPGGCGSNQGLALKLDTKLEKYDKIVFIPKFVLNQNNQNSI